MPNQVTSHNERTLFKAVRALAKDDFLSFEKASEVVEKLLDAGLLIREPAEKEEPKKVYRGETAEAKPAS